MDGRPLLDASAPVGTPVTVSRDNGTLLNTETRSTVYMLDGRTPVVKLFGIVGCYRADRCVVRRARA